MKIYITKAVKRHLYYKQVQQRFLNETIPIFKFIESYNLETFENGKPSIGYWSGIRLLAPIIETLADMESMKPWEFITDKLQVPFGSVAWAMFRNSLLHSDEPYQIRHKKTVVSWSISLNLSSHIFNEGTKTHPATIHLSYSKLLEDIGNYIETKAQVATHRVYQVKVGRRCLAKEQKLISDMVEIKRRRSLSLKKLRVENH